MLRILNHLAEHSHFMETPVVQSGNIIYNIEDRPKRFFPEWYSCTIQERKSQSDEITDENCKDVVVELADRLLDIGSSLQNEAQEDLDLSRWVKRSHDLPD